MADTTRKRLRIQATRRQYRQLQEKINEDVAVWKKADSLKTHHRQLEDLQKVVKAALLRLDAPLKSLGAGTTASICEQCNRYDRSLLWINTIWDYYHEKLTQRNDAALDGFFKAADEVAWSCYATIFQELGIASGPCPLPYLTLSHSPFAVPRDVPPNELRAALLDPQTMEMLQAFLLRLPVPVVGLPAVSPFLPWSLIFIAHEVGHHVLHDLNAVAKFQTMTGNIVCEKFKQLNHQIEDQTQVQIEKRAQVERWKMWSEEIFADLFSVLALGPWALWALEEVLYGEEAALLTEFKSGANQEVRYPPALARLGFMSCVCRTLELMPAPSFTVDTVNIKDMAASKNGDSFAVQREQTRQDLVLGDEVMPALLEAEFFGGRSLKEIFTPNLLSDDAEISRWQEKLAGSDTNLREQQALQMPRYVLSGGVVPWIQLGESLSDDPATAEEAKTQDRKKDEFASRWYEAIRLNREPATRSFAALAGADVDVLGKELADLLQLS